MPVVVGKLINRLGMMKSDRMPHEFVWRDCFDHSFTLRGSGLQQNTLTAQQAADQKARIVDGTATEAGTVLASALQAGMTPANSRWQGIEVFGADDEGMRWLDASSEQLHQEIHNSNFDSIGMDCQMDVVGAGWFAMYVDVDRAIGGFQFEAWPIAQCFCGSSKPGGRVDIIYRAYNLNAAQVVSFAEERGGTVSEVVKKKAVDDPNWQVEMLHVIEPRKSYIEGGRMSKNLPFASYHVEVTTQHMILESGYEEFPVVVPRWNVIPDTAYAVGPMFNVLPDVRELNDLKRIDKTASEMAVMGMYVAVDDGIVNPRTIKVGPRKVIPVGDINSIKPLQSGANWQLADVRITQLQGAIRKSLMADQLQPQGGPTMTATEIHARVALMRQQLGPLFGRMQAEYLQGLVSRCFMLMYRAGRFGQAPESLAGRNFTVKYISPLAKSQKLEEVTSIQQFQAAIGPMAQLKPEILDRVDFEAQLQTMAEGLGIPMSGIRTDDAVMALRQQRSQARAAQASQQQQQQLGQAAVEASINSHAAAAA